MRQYSSPNSEGTAKTNRPSPITRSPITRSRITRLRERASSPPNKLGFTILGDDEGQSVELSFAEIDERARAVAARLQALGGEGCRAMLVYPPGPDFIAAFFGCLYA